MMRGFLGESATESECINIHEDSRTDSTKNHPSGKFLNIDAPHAPLNSLYTAR
jgi:hypothetical protein